VYTGATTTDPYCNAGPPASRVNCGFPGIQPQACYDGGCCYDSTIPEVPWCFHGKNITVSQSNIYIGLT